MRRAFGFAGAWLMATSVAVTASWFGCALVLNGASPATPEVLSSTQARDVLGLPEAAPGATMAAPSGSAVGAALTASPGP